MPMNDKEKARWLKGLSEGILTRGGFSIVTIIALDDKGKDAYAVLTPDAPHKVFRALLLRMLDLPVDEVEVDRRGNEQ